MGELMMRVDESLLSWRETDDGVVVLNLETSRYLQINGSGRLLWTQLVSGATRSDLVTALLDEYGIAEDTAATDVDRFVTGLVSAGLLAQPAQT